MRSRRVTELLERQSAELHNADPAHPWKSLRPREDDDLGLRFVYCSRCGAAIRVPLRVYRADHPGRDRLEEFMGSEGGSIDRKHTADECIRHLRRVVDELLRRFPQDNEPEGSPGRFTGHVTDGLVDELGLPEVDS